MKLIDCRPLYQDGLHYDAQELNHGSDIPFYLKQIQKYGEPVLELACGTGRITIPIAAKGYQIIGLDVSAGMLTQAREKAAKKKLKVKLLRADCRNFKLAERFKAIFFPYNSLAHLHDFESIKSCFASDKKHLAKNGRFILAIFNPRFDILMRGSKKQHFVAKYPNPHGKGMVVIRENNVYDRDSQINHIKWHYKISGQKKEVIHELNMRIFYPQELDALLKYNGFVIDKKYGDYDETPFKSDAPHQLIVCRQE